MGRHEATRRAGRGGTILMVVVALVLLAGGGFLVFRGLQPEPCGGRAGTAIDVRTAPRRRRGSGRRRVAGDRCRWAGAQTRTGGGESVGRPQVPAGPLPDNSVVIPAIGVQTTLDPLGLAPDQSLVAAAGCEPGGRTGPVRRRSMPRTEGSWWPVTSTTRIRVRVPCIGCTRCIPATRCT